MDRRAGPGTQLAAALEPAPILVDAPRRRGTARSADAGRDPRSDAVPAESLRGDRATLAGPERTTRNATHGIDLAELDEHRPYLFKFAMLQVRESHVAEDMVQETLLAALTAGERFAGRSSVRTWLTSILLHKIADHRRKAWREVSIDARRDEEGADSVETLFQANGRYLEMPQLWRTPEEALTEGRFFEVLEGCIRDLPETAGRVFLLRELMGFTIEEICRELDLSASNCSVLLHRARMRLRGCLESRWFAARQGK